MHLINQEARPLPFAFEHASCYNEARSAVVVVEPLSGTLPPNSTQQIALSFEPREQRQHVFNLKCQIGDSSKPLNLNIKGEGFSMLSALYCEDSATGSSVQFSDTMINEIHMGEVEKNEVSQRSA